VARGEEPKSVDEMTVAELRAKASELEITGRSSMNKEQLRQAVVDAEEQIAVIHGNGDSKPEPADGMPPASEITAPSIGPHTVIEHEPPEERLAKHEPSDVDAMGLDKRRGVTGKRYGASFAKQATVYGLALAVIAAILIGGKIAIDELDQGPKVVEDEAPWSQPDAPQHTPASLDFPRNPSP
jgi:Rho termination factor, N-terminal domain